MSGDRRHLRAMWLLPFAAAIEMNDLTLKRQRLRYADCRLIGDLGDSVYRATK